MLVPPDHSSGGGGCDEVSKSCICCAFIFIAAHPTDVLTQSLSLTVQCTSCTADFSQLICQSGRKSTARKGKREQLGVTEHQFESHLRSS